MASRAECIQMCKELEIDYDGLTTGQMAESIREKSDELFSDKSYKVSADGLSDTLKRFLVLEYDYKIKYKNGKEIEIKG